MAQNSLASKTQQNQSNKNELVYMAGGNQITLTPQVVRDYLVSGNKESVTLQEVVMFMNLCKYSGLNPWAREAYCIKYGNEPATMVVGQEAYQKRAESNASYDGIEAGIIVINASGEVIYRTGTLKLPNEEIVGGWAEVYRKDRSHSTRMEVSFDEYAGRKKDGTLNGNWQKKPATMIRKVAKVQALREAFPSAFGGFYAAEEVGLDNEPEATFVANESGTGPATTEQAKTEAQLTPRTTQNTSQTQQEEYLTAPADPMSALFG